jgi:uncharacterized protein
MGTAVSAELLRTARHRAGLSQVELAERAGVAQSVISVYESGRREPSVPTLAALVAATGFTLDMRLTKPKATAALSGPIGVRVAARRQAVLRSARRHGVHVRGVFGSVARGEDTPDSDLDLLVELPPSMGLLGVGRLQEELEALLGTRVDLVAETDLKPGVRDAVLADLVTL